MRKTRAGMGRGARFVGILAGASAALLLGGGAAGAAITGACSNCHTMHNSQNGLVMANFAGESGPNDILTRGSCVGCHAQGGPSKIVTVGGSEIPQVLHTDGTGDLAGGNFAYIAGIKGSGASDAKGHNVIDVVSQDGTLYGPPGGIVQSFHDNGFTVNSSNLTCAGDNGCHGYRIGDNVGGIGSGVKTLKGAHHGNVDGQLTTASTVANSYRFLLGVKGLENPTDRWQNVSSASHNEYYGEPTPASLDCSAGGCHINGYVQPPNNTISGFCGTCHGNFHTLETSTSSGIGADATSPFIRHPNDVVIKNSGEYADYTTYNTDAPVGRPTLPASPSATVTPGTDVVTCLSCHVAHASNYPDMLRWDYTQMVAHNAGGAAGTGCFVCHTTKDD